MMAQAFYRSNIAGAEMPVCMVVPAGRNIKNINDL